MIAEIVTIGTELLLGEIVDSNAAHIARELAMIGVDHFFTSTVGDNEERIVGALRDALARSDVVITTGGLGPTVDDVTRQAVARATGRELVCPPDLLAQIEAFFRRHGYTMTENNRQQAYVPDGAIILENPLGTAPAFIVECDGGAIVSLPGVPHEMRHLLQERVLPYVTAKMGETAVILGRLVHTVGIGESTVGQAISDLMQCENPTVGTRAHPGQTDVRITAKSTTRAAALKLLDAMEVQVRERLGSAVYGVDGQTLPGVVVGDLQRRGLTLALGETNTGGLVGRRLLEVEGGRQVVGTVRVALDGLDMAREVGIRCSVVDEQAARAVAAALRKADHADLALAMLEGLEEGSRAYMALAAPDDVHLSQGLSRGYSGYAVQRALHYGLDMVRRWLMSTS